MLAPRSPRKGSTRTSHRGRRRTRTLIQGLNKAARLGRPAAAKRKPPTWRASLRTRRQKQGSRFAQSSVTSRGGASSETTSIASPARPWIGSPNSTRSRPCRQSSARLSSSAWPPSMLVPAEYSSADVQRDRPENLTGRNAGAEDDDLAIAYARQAKNRDLEAESHRDAAALWPADHSVCPCLPLTSEKCARLGIAETGTDTNRPRREASVRQVHSGISRNVTLA